MTPARSKKIIQNLKKYYGSPDPDLKYKNLYQLTVSVVLSAQTTDKQVNNVTPELFKEYPGFKELSAARISDIEKIIHSTGFYKNKSKNIVNLSKIIVAQYSGRAPGTLKELTTLPGIGRKSANIILSMGHNIPALAVDTHVLRIANRLGYIASDDPLKVEKALTLYIPERDWKISHLLLIKHGRKLCRARKPLCSECPVNSLCDYWNNNS